MQVQCYCTVDDLIKDNSESGLPAALLARFILPASKYVAEEIGRFLPFQETLKTTGKNTEGLYVPALLRLTGTIDNYGLQMSGAILMGANGIQRPMWQDGPYTFILASQLGGLTWVSIPNGIQIPGVWGLYERSEATGASLASLQGVSAETVAVADGSKLSPGMVLLVESEWEFISDYGAPTANATTLAAVLDASSETVSLTSGAAINPGEIIRVEFEQMRVLDVQGNTAFVERGWARTKKVTHLISVGVAVYRTFTVSRGVNGSTAVQHAQAVAISRMIVPEDVNYLTRQIATLMFKKSQGGYAGRSGSPETGETFYTHEFPRDVIARIKSNYFIPHTR